MMDATTPLPHQAGATSIKYSTALRIANNITRADEKLTKKPADQWAEKDLFAHLERAWCFVWDEEQQRWTQA